MYTIILHKLLHDIYCDTICFLSNHYRYKQSAARQAQIVPQLTRDCHLFIQNRQGSVQLCPFANQAQVAFRDTDSGLNLNHKQ